MADEGHSHTKHEITQTNTRFAPQLQESRHSYTNHATITRFTRQLYESRHNYTIHTTITGITPQRNRLPIVGPKSLNSLFPALIFPRTTHGINMATCSSCQAALLTSHKFCPLCGQSKEGNDSVGRSKFTPAPTTNRSSSKTLGYKQFKKLKEEKRATYFRRDSREKNNRNATERLELYRIWNYLD